MLIPDNLLHPTRYISTIKANQKKTLQNTKTIDPRLIDVDIMHMHQIPFPHSQRMKSHLSPKPLNLQFQPLKYSKRLPPCDIIRNLPTMPSVHIICSNDCIRGDPL